MATFQKLLLTSAFSISLIVPSFASKYVPSDAQFEALEKEHPTHFKGFACMPLKVADEFRMGMSNGLKPQPSLSEAFCRLLAKLDGSEEFSALHAELKSTIEAQQKGSLQYTLLRYYYFIFKLAAAQKKGTEEEEYFLRGAGFPYPYRLIKGANFSEMLCSYDHFVAALGEIEDDSDDDESAVIITRRYHDEKDIVENEYVNKGPFKSVVLPLPGEDELGFFYLAWTYFQGIHPAALPLDNIPTELHGILMSRYAKFCHDLAHDQSDNMDEMVEQFIAYLIDYDLKLARAFSGTMPQEMRKLLSVKHVLPHFAQFGMDVHNLYHRCLLDILGLSLIDMRPDQEDKRDDFGAFSVGSFLVGHEEREYIPHAYGTPILKNMLEAEVDLEDEKSEDEVNKDLFKTAFLTGQSELTDQEIFDLVKMRPLSEFQGDDFSGNSNINLNEIVDYQVLRNKFYTEVIISMLDGTEHKFRQDSNYTIRLNLKHDWTILKAAATVLKRDYAYELPTIPELAAFQDEAIYEQAARDCRKALDLGFKHLKDNWLKQAIRLSELKLGDSPSIAETFTAEYTAALERGRQNCFPGLEPEVAYWQSQIQAAVANRNGEQFDINNSNINPDGDINNSNFNPEDDHSHED